METVTFEVVIHHFSKFWPIWEAALLLGGKLVRRSDSDNAWERTHFLVFQVEVSRAESFETKLRQEFESHFDLTRLDHSNAAEVYLGAESH